MIRGSLRKISRRSSLRRKLSKRSAIVASLCMGALLVLIVFGVARVMAQEVVVPSIYINSALGNYENGDQGAWHVEKSAKWVDYGKAEVTFEFTSNPAANRRSLDIIFVIDTSGSMRGDKIERVASDMRDVLSYMEGTGNDRAALITFGRTGSRIFDLSDDLSGIADYINAMGTGDLTSYYAGLKEAEKIIDEYSFDNSRSLAILFLTDGYPNVDTPSEIGLYNLIKQKYPHVAVNAIQYEMDKEVLDPIRVMSDHQFVADMSTLHNVLYDAAQVSGYYDEFRINDYINDKYFTIGDVSDIEVPYGDVSVEYDGTTPVVKWNADEHIMTGKNVKMTIPIYLKDEYFGSEEYYPTNKKEDIITDLYGVGSDNVTSDDTPILKGDYWVTYEANSPSDCTVAGIPERRLRTVFEVVEIDDSVPTCSGYDFSGYKFVGEDLAHINHDYFVMPEHEVVLRATWIKVDIEKSMEGTVSTGRRLYTEVASHSNGLDSGIDFGAVSSPTNGDGANTMASTAKDAYPVHYYRGKVEDNNVKIGSFCWKILHTTPAGGVRLAYNGYSCRMNSDTMPYIYISGASDYRYNNGAGSSPAGVGYMYGDDVKMDNTVTTTARMHDLTGNAIKFNSRYYYADSIHHVPTSSTSCPNGYYMLDNPKRIGSLTRNDLVGKYFLTSDSQTSTCGTVYYGFVPNSSGDYIYTLKLSDGKMLEDINTTFTYGDEYVKNADGSYTIVDPQTTDVLSWPETYEDVAHKYVCENAVNNTCTDMRYNTAGHQHGPVYLDLDNTMKFANSFRFEDGHYILDEDSTITVWNFDSHEELERISNAHYTCLSMETTCDTIKYVYQINYKSSGYVGGEYAIYHITLENGESITQAYERTMKNEHDSEAKIKLDQWYEGNLADLEIAAKFEDSPYCNDRSVYGDSVWNPNGGSVESTSIYFGAYGRNVKNKTPSLECPNMERDAFTVSAENGNGKLTYPIGLMTADELTLAGQASGTTNNWNTSFLYANSYNAPDMWTMSPYFASRDYAAMFVWRSGARSTMVYSTSTRLRPVITLTNDVFITGGDGSINNPWTVE